MMRLLAVTFLSMLLAACGGGGSVRPDPPVVPPAAYRTDLLMGYYGGNQSVPAEVKDHANLYWAPGWGSVQETIGELLNAASIPNIVLAVPAYSASPESDTRGFLTALKNAGVLSRIVALYPIDEPDVNGKSDEQVTATNAMLRRVMAGFSELAGTKLAVIYGCATGGRPGLSSYDWVGCDDYGAGCGVLSVASAQLRAALGPNQRLMLVPGGASPWNQNPACFETYAHENPIVVAIVTFLWQTVTDRGNTYTGVRDNGMATAYRAVGTKIMKP